MFSVADGINSSFLILMKSIRGKGNRNRLIFLISLSLSGKTPRRKKGTSSLGVGGRERLIVGNFGSLRIHQFIHPINNSIPSPSQSSRSLPLFLLPLNFLTKTKEKKIKRGNREENRKYSETYWICISFSPLFLGDQTLIYVISGMFGFVGLLDQDGLGQH